MFPTFPIFGIASLSAEALLLALGVLAALATAERLAVRLRLRADRVYTAALLAGVSLWAGERLVLVLRGWRDFLAHPLWMVGIVTVRDGRLFYVGAGIAVIVCVGYLVRHRVPLRGAADALLPALGVLLAFVQAGYFAAGAEPGRVTRTGWGIVSTNRVARALYGTPMGVPLLPAAALACLGYAGVAVAAVWLAARGRAAAGWWLLGAGLVAVGTGQLAMRWAGEPLVLGMFTWAQAAGVVSVVAGGVVLLVMSEETSARARRG